MAKRIIMIPPFEVLTGNLSGKQNLQYAENNNPAFEAPNGTQGARNYAARYVGAKRADGKTYFGVRRKNTAVLNEQTRLQMALLGAIAATRSAVMALPATGLGLIPWKHIVKCAAAYKEANPTAPDAKSVNTYFDARARRILRYKQASYTFIETGVPGGWTLENPFKLDNLNAIVIAQPVWNKFCLLLAFGYDGFAQFTIDKFSFITPLTSMTWGAIKPMLESCSSNFKASWNDITIDNDDNVLFRGLDVYSSAGIHQTSSSTCAVDAYTTIAPTA